MARKKNADNNGVPEIFREISKGILAIDLFSYLPEHETFIISDIHVGFEESLNKSGILIPRNNYDDLVLRIEKAIECTKKIYPIKSVVLNGDLLHEFAKISRDVKDKLHRFIKFLSKYGEVMVIEGNHDKTLRFIIDLPVHKKLTFGKILVTHGDILLEHKGIDTIIIGHEHPAVCIKSGARSERYKCFLKGKYDRKELIVMPSCNLFVEGTDVNTERLLSPYLKKSKVLEFEVFIVEDKIYGFGKVKNLPGAQD